MHAMTVSPVPSARLSVAALDRVAVWLAPAVLLAVAVAVRAWAAGQITFPVNEGSAFYVGVARNLVEGRGLVSDAIWSYATPPLVLPKPAFELWMPMGSLIAAPAMAMLGTTFAAAQAGAVLMGALVAPLAWIVARQAAAAAGLEGQRAWLVTAGSGLIAALLAPLVIPSAVPDSTVPFLVFGVASALAMAHHIRRPSIGTGVGTGVLLGLAYLSRQEALYLGLTFLLLGIPQFRGAAEAGASRPRQAVRLILPVVAGGLLAVLPWLVRNLAAYGTLFPGQALENAYLATNEQIFAYAERPTLGSLLDQGPAVIGGHIVEALSHNLVAVILLPALPVGALGLLAILLNWRRSAARRDQAPTALGALLVSGLLTYLVTSVAFPVATRWGTFGHAAGPLLVGLTVVTVLALDAGVAWLGRRRAWARSNAWLAPLAATAIALPFCLLQITALSGQARTQAARIAAVASALVEGGYLDEGGEQRTATEYGAAVISDHPIWLAEALRRPAIALPDETPAQVAGLAREFGMPIVAVIDDRGRYPETWLRAPAGGACLDGPPRPISIPDGTAWLFSLDSGCSTP